LKKSRAFFDPRCTVRTQHNVGEPTINTEIINTEIPGASRPLRISTTSR